MTTQNLANAPGMIAGQPNPPDLRNASRELLRGYFESAWQLEDYLFTSIRDERGFYTYGEPLRHPPIFYLLHSPVFYVNKLIMAGEDIRRIDPEIEEVFAEGIDPPNVESRVPLRTQPSLADARRYRDRALDVVSTWFEKTTVPACIEPGTPCWAFMMAIEHQRIHFETSSVIIRQMPLDLLQEPDGWTYADSSYRTPENTLVTIDAGEAVLGRDTDTSTFGWDNEFGRRAVQVPRFSVTRSLVSNGEYLAFQHANPASPLPRFWIASSGGVRYRAMFREMDLPLDWPVEVDFNLARGYAQWSGLELPNEAEFARYSRRCGTENLNFAAGSPTRVDRSGNGIVNDPAGNVWQWLDQTFYPLPGFRVDPLYPTFSSPYFTEDHKMMLGGSWATTGEGALPSYRLWFRKHFYQHAGFRLVQRHGH